MTSMRAIATSFFAISVVVALATPAPTRAANYSPTRYDDPVPNGCQPADCSLREAVMAANVAPGSAVQLRAGTYFVTIPGADTAITNPGIGDIDIMAAMTIRGMGSSATIIQAGGSKGAGVHRIFDIHSLNAVVISSMTLRFGTDVEGKSGGCVKNTGVLTIEFVLVTGCTTTTAGGGIASYNTLTVRDSVISNNTASSTLVNAKVAGGGIAGGPKPTTAAPGTITIVRTVIRDNAATNTGGGIAYGGGFSNTGTMSIASSTITNNSADSSAGGISDPRPSTPDGSMTIDSSTFSYNKAKRDAGGLDNDGVMTVQNSTFVGNQAGYKCVLPADCAQGYAGGLLNTATATIDVINSTFTGNSCPVSGGGLLNSKNATQGGTMRVYNSTVVGNTCNLGGGVSSNASGKTYLRNTIVANNAFGPTGGDCSGVVTSEGYNLIRTVRGCSVIGNTTGNIATTDPRLGPLQNNGGQTMTRAPLAGSPALNSGNPAGCTRQGGAALTFDQRGFSRPALGRCDIGAYELEQSTVVWTADNSATITQLNGGTTLRTATVAGPGAGWTAQSYWRQPDGSYSLLWSTNNTARVSKMGGNDVLATSNNHTGPGTGFLATSLLYSADGGYELLWTKDNAAQVWRFSANGSPGLKLTYAGPGPGFRASSYFTANDQTRRIVWTAGNIAQVWTLASDGLYRAAATINGPAGSTATSHQVNDDGTYVIAWSSSNMAQLWTMNADGTFRSKINLTGPVGRTAQSYFFR